MQVISRHKIVVPDNDDRAPNVIPMPSAAYEATLSWEQAEMLSSMILGQDEGIED